MSRGCVGNWDMIVLINSFTRNILLDLFIYIGG